MGSRRTMCDVVFLLKRPSLSPTHSSCCRSTIGCLRYLSLLFGVGGYSRWEGSLIRRLSLLSFSNMQWRSLTYSLLPQGDQTHHRVQAFISIRRRCNPSPFLSHLRHRPGYPRRYTASRACFYYSNGVLILLYCHGR